MQRVNLFTITSFLSLGFKFPVSLMDTSQLNLISKLRNVYKEHAVRGTERFNHNLFVTRRFVRGKGFGMGLVLAVIFLHP